jgi:hypothetical protein
MMRMAVKVFFAPESKTFQAESMMREVVLIIRVPVHIIGVAVHVIGVALCVIRDGGSSVLVPVMQVLAVLVLVLDRSVAVLV